MSSGILPQKEQKEKPALSKISRWRFSREIERKFFFFLTLAMLVMGLLDKAGIW